MGLEPQRNASRETGRKTTTRARDRFVTARVGFRIVAAP